MKVSLCCIVKKENNYLQEFVEYYHNIGIDKIFIYDNNDIDGENPNDVLQQYDYVEVIDYRGKRQSQYDAYNECYRNCKEYDWFLPIDCDEFLVLNKDKTIQEYLSRECFNNYDAININWKIFDDNDLLGNEDNCKRTCLDRFTRYRKPPEYCNEYMHHKYIIRENLDINIDDAHYADGNIRYCNNYGESQGKCATSFTNYNLACINHYKKTIIEFIEQKLNRGFADRNPYNLSNFNYIWRFIEKTPAKLAIMHSYMDSKIIPYNITKDNYNIQTKYKETCIIIFAGYINENIKNIVNSIKNRSEVDLFILCNNKVKYKVYQYNRKNNSLQNVVEFYKQHTNYDYYWCFDFYTAYNGDFNYLLDFYRYKTESYIYCYHYITKDKLKCITFNKIFRLDNSTIKYLSTIDCSNENNIFHEIENDIFYTTRSLFNDGFTNDKYLKYNYENTAKFSYKKLKEQNKFYYPVK